MSAHQRIPDNPPQPRPLKRGLRLRAALIRTGLGKTAFYAAINRGDLPKPRKIGVNSVWDEEVLDRVMKGETVAQATAAVAVTPADNS